MGIFERIDHAYGMHQQLGWLLLAGGIGYVLSTFVTQLLSNANGVAAALLAPSIVGEFWMIGFLLVKGASGFRKNRTTSEG